MTRINCIPPSELTRQHLLAEYRELPRVFTLAKAYWDKHGCLPPDMPDQYMLGKGHVKFFYNKLGYLHLRFTEIVTTMLDRGYTPKYLNFNLSDFPDALMGDWEPDKTAMEINLSLIHI